MYLNKYLITLIVSLLYLTSSLAQVEGKYGKESDSALPLWAQEMYSDNPDVGDVVTLYELYYEIHDFIKNGHTQYYKRWLRELSREVKPSKESDAIYLKQRIKQSNKKAPSTWTSIGPIDWDHDAANRSYAPGCAHVYTIEQSVTNHDVLYAGTANAGIWKTIDHGLNWTSITGDYLSNNCTAIAIDHTNEDIIYVELLSSVYKSIDGGLTLLQTGDAAFQNLSLNIKDILISPSNANIIFMVSDNGFYKSTDGGNNWVEKKIGDYIEIEIHPTVSNIIYTVAINGDKTEFYRSTDGGNIFSIQTTGWPNPDTANGAHNRWVEIAVSADAPDRVYAHATGSANGGSGLYGMYLSTDKGVTWTFDCCGPQPAGPPSASNMNLMGWSDLGLDDGGQYYYDIGLDVSPTDADSVFLAGVNLWVSDDSGSSFVCPSKWSHSYKPNYVHADIHDVKYFEDSEELWVVGDGGIFFSDDSGANFHRRIKGISGTDFWGYGQGFWYGDVMLGGAYHNGTMLREESTYINNWVCTDGGDGVRGFVHPMIDRQVYSDYNIKTLTGDRTLNPPTRTFSFKPNGTYTTGISSELLFHPKYYHTYYSGSDDQLIKTEDNGHSFTIIHDFNEDLASMAISDSNPDVLYVCTYPGWWSTKHIYRTIDGGANWTDITPVVPNRDWICYDIEVDPLDPLHIWIARTNFYSTPEIDGASVYESIDGGNNWTNISGTGLNGQSPTNIVHQKGSNGGLYVGTRRSVYHKDNSTSDWSLYSPGLPASTHSLKLVPYYRKQVIRNATNRSVYEVDFKESNISVIARPTVQKAILNCTQDTAFFVDYSIVSESSVQWAWTFEGGNPATSIERAPKVIYDCPGKYDVTLTVTDIDGTDTKVINDFIEVLDDCSPDPNQNQALNNVPNNGHVIIPDLNVTSNTFTISAWVKPSGIQANYSAIFMNDGTSAGLNFRESNNTLGYHWPGGSWSWDSNLVVPEGEWSYVSMVVTPSSITLYLNGEGVTHNISASMTTFGQCRIGSYKGWTGRNFDGLIDEFCIWDRALTEAEIREMRHLRKLPVNQTAMIAYYNFDQFNIIANDLAGNNDGTFNGSANKMLTAIPVGYGESDRLSINSSGTYTLPNTDVEMVFGAGVGPDGEIVMSSIDQLPHTPPIRKSLDRKYYILNNYGNAATFSNMQRISIDKIGIISTEMTQLNDFLQLDFVGENDVDQTWLAALKNQVQASSGNPGKVDFNNASNLKTSGQYIITRDNYAVKSGDMTIKEIGVVHNNRRGGGSVSLSLLSNNQGFQLPRVSLSDIQNTPNPSEGLVAYYLDKNTLLYFDGSDWRQTVSANITLDGTFSTVDATNGINFGIGGLQPSAVLAFDAGLGFVKFPLVADIDLVDIQTSDDGMLIYNSDQKALQYHDGVSWVPLLSKITTLAVSTSGTGIANIGFSIGVSSRDPNAVLELHGKTKALGMTVVDVYDIANPVEGLMIYDKNLKQILIYNGNSWRKLITIK